MKRYFSFCLMIFLIIGCAKVEVRPVDKNNPNQEGVRFWRPDPYLWVTEDKDGKLQGTIIWLPNKKEEYIIDVSSGVGTIDAKVTLEHGWNLTQYGDVRDSKTPEMLNAIKGLLPSGVGVKVAELPPPGQLLPGLYRLTFDEKEGFINGYKTIFMLQQVN